MNFKGTMNNRYPDNEYLDNGYFNNMQALDIMNFEGTKTGCLKNEKIFDG